MVYTKRGDWSNRGMSGKKKSEDSKIKQGLTRSKNLAEGKIIIWNKGATTRPNKEYVSGYKHIKGRNNIPMSHFVYCSQPNNLQFVPNGMEIHHLDCNHSNNNYYNLIMLPMKYHRHLHNEISKLLNAQN